MAGSVYMIAIRGGYKKGSKKRRGEDMLFVYIRVGMMRTHDPTNEQYTRSSVYKVKQCVQEKITLTLYLSRCLDDHATFNTFPLCARVLHFVLLGNAQAVASEPDTSKE